MDVILGGEDIPPHRAATMWTVPSFGETEIQQKGVIGPQSLVCLFNEKGLANGDLRRCVPTPRPCCAAWMCVWDPFLNLH